MSNIIKKHGLEVEEGSVLYYLMDNLEPIIDGYVQAVPPKKQAETREMLWGKVREYINNPSSLMENFKLGLTMMDTDNIPTQISNTTPNSCERSELIDSILGQLYDPVLVKELDPTISPLLEDLSGSRSRDEITRIYNILKDYAM